MKRANCYGRINPNYGKDSHLTILIQYTYKDSLGADRDFYSNDSFDDDNMLDETQSTDCSTDDQLDTTPTLHRKFFSQLIKFLANIAN